MTDLAKVLTDERVRFEAWVKANTGIIFSPGAQSSDFYFLIWQASAEQARAAERERCARVCEAGADGTSAGFASGCRSCALLIRNPVEGSDPIRSGQSAEGMVSVPVEIVQAAKALVAKMDEMHSHPSFESIWVMLKVYRGPTYEHELAALRAAIAGEVGK